MEGTPIGIREIQSILMSATQTSLSHFHTAGMSRGVSDLKPSIAETFDSIYRPENTCMIIESDMNIREIRKNIVYKRLDSFIIKVKSDIVKIPERENIWYNVLDERMFDTTFIRLYVDYKKMYRLGLTLNDIGETCFSDIKCRWLTSPDFMGMIDIGDFGQYMSPILSKMNVQIFGTKNILSCERYENSTYITEGSDILFTSEFAKVIKSNNVSDVEKCLGIEAATNILAELIGSTIISDFMTRTGTVLSFNKRSVEVSRKGILTSMGFERPKEDIKAAVLLTTKTATKTKQQVYHNIITGDDQYDMFQVLM